MRFFAITAFLSALAVASPIIEMVERGGDKPDPKEVRIESTSCPLILRCLRTLR